MRDEETEDSIFLPKLKAEYKKKGLTFKQHGTDFEIFRIAPCGKAVFLSKVSSSQKLVKKLKSFE